MKPDELVVGNKYEAKLMRMTNKEAITKFRKQLDDACVRHAFKKDTQMVALESITLEEARILRDECDNMLEDIRNEEDYFEADPMTTVEEGAL
jgi:predicted ATPase